MADQDAQKQEQPKGGDHIPTDTQEEEPESTGSGGLLSKIGDPVGTFLTILVAHPLRAIYSTI